MSRIGVGSGLVSILLAAACGSGAAGGVDTFQAAQVAQQVREGCVGENLDLLQDLADRLGPLAYAADLPELELLAAAAGCDVVAGPEAIDLVCPAVPVRDGVVGLAVSLRQADGILIAAFTAEGLYSRSEGEVRFDPASGLAVAGELTTEYVDGCTVVATLDNVQGLLAADLPGLETGLVFTGGNVALDVLDRGAPYVNGTAALVGRRAVVVLQYGGVFTEGEIALDR